MRRPSPTTQPSTTVRIYMDSYRALKSSAGFFGTPLVDAIEEAVALWIKAKKRDPLFSAYFERNQANKPL
jgi:hypothetical protein